MDTDQVAGGGGADLRDVERSGGSGNAPQPTVTTPLRQQPRSGIAVLAGSSRMRRTATHARGGAGGVYALVCGTVCCSFLIAVVFLILVNIVSISSIIIGALHLHDCPGSPNIPVMLIALGVIAFLIGVMDTIERAREARLTREAGDAPDALGREDALEEIKKPSCITFMNSVFKLAQFTLFIYACVIVFRIFPSVDYKTETNPNYCHPLAYMFAFWFLTITLIVLGIVFAFLVCICFCAGALLVATSD